MKYFLPLFLALFLLPALTQAQWKEPPADQLQDDMARYGWASAGVYHRKAAVNPQTLPVQAKEINVTCPAPKLLPILDAAYHSCRHYADGSCERFVETFRKLLPKYDCQRSFDGDSVPAIWLSSDGEMDDYVDLLWRMSSSRDQMFANESFPKEKEAIAEAKRLFASEEFRSVLDGALAEEYEPRSKKLETQLKLEK